MSFKEKYLKYKEKYIRLKKLMGGDCEKCPDFSFYQHFGECWHDALSTVVLFSDGLSETIQQIFNNTEFDIRTLTEQVVEKVPLWLSPINISLDDTDNEILYDKFIELSIEYILNLYTRYNNIFKKSSTTYDKPVMRLNSLPETLTCTLAIYNIENINKFIKEKYKILDHGGGIVEDKTAISVLNYFILDNHRSDITDYKFINIFNFNLEKCFINDNIYIFQRNIKNINEYIIDKKVSNIVVIDYLTNLIDKFKIIREKITSSTNILLNIQRVKDTGKSLLRLYGGGHSLSLFQCKGEQYFYDDNGTIPDKIEPIDPFIESDDVESDDDEIDSALKEKLFTKKKDFPEKFMVEKVNTDMYQNLTKFNWKSYLLANINVQIEYLTKYIEHIKTQKKIDTDFLHSVLIKCWQTFTGFFYKNNDTPYIGRKYLKYYLLGNFTILFMDSAKTESEYLNKIFYNSSYVSEFKINSRIEEYLDTLSLTELGDYIYKYDDIMQTIGEDTTETNKQNIIDLYKSINYVIDLLFKKYYKPENLDNFKKYFEFFIRSYKQKSYTYFEIIEKFFIMMGSELIDIEYLLAYVTFYTLNKFTFDFMYTKELELYTKPLLLLFNTPYDLNENKKDLLDVFRLLLRKDRDSNFKISGEIIKILIMEYNKINPANSANPILIHDGRKYILYDMIERISPRIYNYLKDFIRGSRSK